MKVSQSAKNPGKAFVACNKDYGGCGLFCFVENEPNEKYNPNNGFKRPRADGNNIVGPIAAKPGVHEERLAELATAIDELRTQVLSQLGEVLEYLKQ
jgi:hypothetical protein